MLSNYWHVSVIYWDILPFSSLYLLSESYNCDKICKNNGPNSFQQIGSDESSFKVPITRLKFADCNVL